MCWVILFSSRFLITCLLPASSDVFKATADQSNLPEKWDTWEIGWKDHVSLLKKVIICNYHTSMVFNFYITYLIISDLYVPSCSMFQVFLQKGMAPFALSAMAPRPAFWEATKRSRKREASGIGHWACCWATAGWLVLKTSGVVKGCHPISKDQF